MRDAFPHPATSVRISAWIDEAPVHATGGRRRQSLARALGLRLPRRYPAQARAAGESLVVRMDAAHSPFERQNRGVLRSYLERGEVAPDVLQAAAFEYALDRWSIWINLSEADVNPMTLAHVLTTDLERRFGVPEEDVFVVQHHDEVERDPQTGRVRAVDGSAWHLHAVVPHREGMRSEERQSRDGGLDDRATVTAMAREIARELVLERAIERALDPARKVVIESGWDLPATDAQRAVLRGAGRADPALTRGAASLIIEQLGYERSWAHERER